MRDPRRAVGRPAGAPRRSPGRGGRLRRAASRARGERAPNPPPRSARTPPRRASLTGRAAVLALVLGVLAVSFAYPLRAWWDQHSRLAELRAEQSVLQGSVERLEADRERWRDPAFVRAQARARLSYVLPGEDGYIVLDESGAAGEGEQVEPGMAPVADEGPWWSRLWSSVEAADAPEVPGGPFAPADAEEAAGTEGGSGGAG